MMMMKMMTSREDRATITAMIGMSSDWGLSADGKKGESKGFAGLEEIFLFT